LRVWSGKLSTRRGIPILNEVAHFLDDGFDL
jgi:hypothetical protein